MVKVLQGKKFTRIKETPSVSHGQTRRHKKPINPQATYRQWESLLFTTQPCFDCMCFSVWLDLHSVIFFCAIADRARSLVGQRFSYVLRGHAVIAKTWVPENTNRKQKPKPQTKQQDPAKEVPRELGEKVKLTRPKPLPSAVLPQRKSDFPFNLPFCTPVSQAQNPSADNPHKASTNAQ